MGGNTSKLTQKFVDNVNTSFSNHLSSNAETDCTLKKIKFDVKNCHVGNYTEKNDCVAKASSNLSQISAALVKTLQQATDKQKADALSGANTVIKGNITKTDIETAVKNSCNSDSKVKNVIQDSSIKCDGGSIDNINVVNFGDAKAQCGMKTALNMVQKADQKSRTDQTAKSSIAKGIGDLFGSIGSALKNLTAGFGAFGWIIPGIIAIAALVFMFKMFGGKSKSRYNGMSTNRSINNVRVPNRGSRNNIISTSKGVAKGLAKQVAPFVMNAAMI